METLTISASRQLDGYTFGLAPLSKKWLSEKLPVDKAVFGNIFVAHGAKANFEERYGPIAKHILLTILSVTSVQLAMLKKQVQTVRFEDPVSHQPLLQLNLQDVEA